MSIRHTSIFFLIACLAFTPTPRYAGQSAVDSSMTNMVDDPMSSSANNLSYTDPYLDSVQIHHPPYPNYAESFEDPIFDNVDSEPNFPSYQDHFFHPVDGLQADVSIPDTTAREHRSIAAYLPLVLANHRIPTTVVYLPLVLDKQLISNRSDSTPKGMVHIVQAGDTLAAIAQRCNSTVSDIMRDNGLSEPNFIWIGQRLHIGSSCSAQDERSGSDRSTKDTPERWIEVVLSTQRTIAWQGDEQVRTMIVSTGTSRHPTVTGRFQVYAKFLSRTMSGPEYTLQDVPDVMFFYKGYAIHGTYWHSNFGQPMSHGCVNLSKADAAWLFRWAPMGTLVVVRD